MQRIRVISPITRLIVGGAQETVMETCSCLPADRFDTMIVSGPDTGSEGELISAVREQKIPLTIIPELIRSPHPAKDFTALQKLTALFREHKPHIVHTHSSKAGILGRWAAKRAGVPVIVHTVHGWGHSVFGNVLKRSLFTFLERKTASITDTLIVVSSLNAQKGLDDNIGTPRQYRTIHSCINIEHFQHTQTDISSLKQSLGLNPDHRVVGTVARLSPQKNPADFVRVAAAVKKQQPRTQFLFVGDGPLRNNIVEQARQAGLLEDILLPGLRTDVPDLLACMDVFILTSLWEGLPRVIPQAMAAGVPVVANAVDGVCEILQDGNNGFLIPPHDTALMAKRVSKLLSDNSLRLRIIKNGRTTAREGYSLSVMVTSIQRLYEELLTKKGISVSS